MTLSPLPSEPHPPRMDRLARLPLFMTLAGKRVVVAGGSPAAAWKAELLSATGARVDVYALKPCDDLMSLAGGSPSAVTIHHRDFVAQDCAGAAIAVGAIEDDADARRFAADVRAASVLVNVVDRPDGPT